ncbi:MAG: PAS domain-containing sensor histidine kinase [Candidatus Tantalella remota]|nr:PAS domain-containing sensor histidine kinase [Candidatus Tantalella remota]
MKMFIIIVIVALFFGALTWMFDIAVDYFVYDRGDIVGLLFSDVSSHELYMRFIPVMLFIVFGVIIATYLARYRKITGFTDTLLKTVPFGMEIVDEEGNILFMNELLKDMLGGDALGEKCWQMYKDDNEQCGMCPLLKGVNVGETASIETEHAMGGKTLLITHTGMMYEGRKAILEIFQDISTRKKAEEVLIQTTKIKSDFVSMVTHELQTPLAVIKESVGLILRGSAGEINNSKQEDFLKMVVNNSERLMRLISNVLDFQKLEAGKEKIDIKENDLNSVVKEVYEGMQYLAKEKGIALEIHLTDKMPTAGFDRDKIIQVLTNLVNNAIKFTDKGKVTVTTCFDEKIVQVEVRDTGAGIKKKDLPRLFIAFEQLHIEEGRRAGGTGLGLSISKEIIRRHKGKIWAESEEGKGAVFHFVIPRGAEKIEKMDYAI